MERQLVPMSEVQPEPIAWLWPDRIPLGAITGLDGDPGSGKSTIVNDIAARLTRGNNMPSCDAALPAGGVVLLQAEDDLGATVHPRLRAAGADLDRILVYPRTAFACHPLTLPDDMELLEAAAERVQAKLVVLDPLAAFLAGAMASEVSARRALAPLAEMAQRRRLAVLVVRHLVKAGSSSSNPLYRGAGSIAIAGTARSVLLVGADPAHKDPHRHVLAQTKTYLAAPPSLAYQTRMEGGVLRIDWLGPIDATADDLTAASRRERPQTQEAMCVLYGILCDGRVKANVVIRKAREAGVRERTLDRAKKELGVVSRRHGIGMSAYWTWELPQDSARVRHCREADIDSSGQSGAGPGKLPAAPDLAPTGEGGS
jgi:hypothetical protein